MANGVTMKVGLTDSQRVEADVPCVYEAICGCAINFKQPLLPLSIRLSPPTPAPNNNKTASPTNQWRQMTWMRSWYALFKSSTIAGRRLDSGCLQLQIRRKRRRTAIDPCLGYYRRDLGDGELSASGHQEKVGAEEVQETGQEKVATSDSAPNVTSPYSEDAALVAVDDFLRHQAVPSTRPCRTTYSHRKRGRTDLLSEDETNEPALDDYIPGVSSSLSPSPSPRPITSRRAKSNKIKASHRSLRKPRKETGLSFSKRIRRAALLSHVEHDDDVCDIIGSAPLPLTLAPFKGTTSPRSPLQDKRIRYVDIE